MGYLTTWESFLNLFQNIYWLIYNTVVIYKYTNKGGATMGIGVFITIGLILLGLVMLVIVGIYGE